MTLGQRIQELRKGAGLSQEGLGEALGVSRQAVSKWEGDNGIPELDTLIAMSRLFGVPLGQLLGVEEPEAAGEEEPAPAALTAEQVEDILRRYAQENKKHQSAPKPIRWQLPLAAGCLLLVLVIVLFAQIGSLKNTMSDLQHRLSSLQSDVSGTQGQINSIYHNIGEEIRQQLEAQAYVVDTFEYEVAGVDLERKTVDLKLQARLRSYDEKTSLQFILESEAGQVVSQGAAAPEFAATVTVPMHHHVEVRARITGADGTVTEEQVKTLYSLTEDNFVLNAGHLLSLYQISVDIPFGMKTSMPVSEDHPGLLIYSDYPGMVWPEAGTLVLEFNGEVLDQKVVDLVYDSEEQAWYFKTERREFLFRETGELTAKLTLTDNFGRVQEFTEGWYIDRDGMDRMPVTAPAVRPD